MKTHSSNLNNSHKLPILLSDMLYQCDEGSKLSIDVINDTNALRALVNEYLSSMVGSEMFLWNKFVRVNGGHFVTVTSLVNNELFMTKFPPVTDRTVFNVYMKVNNNNGMKMKL